MWFVVGVVSGSVAVFAVVAIAWRVYKKRKCYRKYTQGECFNLKSTFWKPRISKERTLLFLISRIITKGCVCNPVQGQDPGFFLGGGAHSFFFFSYRSSK